MHGPLKTDLLVFYARSNVLQVFDAKRKQLADFYFLFQLKRRCF